MQQGAENDYGLVTVGASWGGLGALIHLLSALPKDFCMPIVVAQHRHPKARHPLELLLAPRTALSVREAQDRDTLAPGVVYLAPADYHLLVEPGFLSLSLDEQVRYSRPSIDVLFESAADAYADRLVGVILTGSNRDGADGIATVKRCGGLAVVQDPDTAERREMPDAAIAAAPVDHVLGLAEIASLLREMCGAEPRLSSTGAGT